MAVGVYFMPSSLTGEQYDEISRRLQSAGAPPGQLHHFALETDGNISVFDTWESEEAFHASFPALKKVLDDVGVDPGQPQVMKIHNSLAS